MFFDGLLHQILSIHASIENRSDLRELRAIAFEEATSTIVKTAFDHRRINQETQFNPRRNLQYYIRSEPFIAVDTSAKLKSLFKLKTAVDTVKEDFIGDPDWHDSYCRVLSAALDRTLRVAQGDMDFSNAQLDYLNELLYLRYRLNDDAIKANSENELRNIILDKDERLKHKEVYANYASYNVAKKTGVVPATSDALIDKLFGDIKASKQNPSISRTVTITIDDKIKDG